MDGSGGMNRSATSSIDSISKVNLKGGLNLVFNKMENLLKLYIIADFFLSPTLFKMTFKFKMHSKTWRMFRPNLGIFRE